MYSETRRLKYANITTTVHVYDTNLETWDNIYEDFQADVRGRVVCRHDLIPHLNRFFSEEFISKNRQALLILAQGSIKDADTLSSFISTILEEDEKFREGINILFGDCPYDMSFGEYIGIGLAKELIDFVQNTRVRWAGHKEFVICESDGYMYFSVPDDSSYSMCTFDRSDYEVIHYGKNWNPDN